MKPLRILALATVLLGGFFVPAQAQTYPGVFTCAANQWMSSVAIGGVPVCTQPAFSNLSGSVSAAQLPAGVDANILNTQTANYSIATTDCGKRIQAGTGSTGLFTVTLPAVAGFATTCRVSVVNGDTGRGKKLSGFPTGTPAILYPIQEIDVAIVNGAWALVDNPVRWQLTAATTVFVDVTNGNDANDGLASGAGNALATVQKAWDTAANFFDLAGQTLTIQLADGTYTAGLLTFRGMVGAKDPADVIIKGNTATPANVIVSTTSADALGFGIQNGGNEQGANVLAYVKDMELRTTTGGNGLEAAGPGVNILFDNIRFGAIAGSQISVGIGSYVANAGAVSVPGAPGAYFVTGNATSHAIVAEGGQLTLHGATITYSNNPAFTTNFSLLWGGRIFAAGMTFTNGGTVTGQRFSVLNNSILHTLGSLTYLPGSTAGVVGSGGQYLGSTAQDGTWTPTLIGSTSGNWTLSVAVGSYELNGRMLTVRFTLIASASNAPVGNIQIGGLPFAAVAVTNDNGHCVFTEQGGLTNTASYTIFSAFIGQGTSVVALLENGSGQTAQLAAVARAGATPFMLGMCNYRIY